MGTYSFARTSWLASQPPSEHGPASFRDRLDMGVTVFFWPAYHIVRTNLTDVFEQTWHLAEADYCDYRSSVDEANGLEGTNVLQ